MATLQIVVEHAPDLAGRRARAHWRVRSIGPTTEAKDKRKQKRENIERDAELRAQAPDLVEMVADDRLTFDEAWAAYEKRTEAARREKAEREDGWRRANTRTAEAIHTLAWGPNELDSFITAALPHHTEHVPNGMQISAQRLDTAIATLTALRERITS